jgi:hypothetical protein
MHAAKNFDTTPQYGFFGDWCAPNTFEYLMTVNGIWYISKNAEQ